MNLYVLAWSAFNVFRVIQERGLAAPFFVLVHQEQRDPVAYLGSSLLQQRLFAIGSTACFVLSAGIIATTFNRFDIGSSLLAIGLAGPFLLLRDHLRAVCCAHSRYDVAVVLSVVAMSLQIFLIVSLAFFYENLAIEFAFGAMGIASLVACLIWFIWKPFNYVQDRNRFKADWQDTFEYSKWLVAARFFPSAAMGVLPWLMVWLVDEDASGVFGACITVANISNMFVFGANYFFLPRTVKALNAFGKSGLMRVLSETVVTFSLVLSLLCIFYWLAGDWILEIAFDPSFRGFSSLVSLIGVSYLIVSYSTVAGNGMTALERPEGLFWGELAFGIVLVLMGVLLIWSYGLWGAACAMCLASFVATVVESNYLMSTLKSKFRSTND